VEPPRERVQFFSSDKVMTQPFVFIRRCVEEILTSKQLTFALFLRDLKAQYRQSFLGYLWIIIPPLLTTITFYILNDIQVINVGKNLKLPYPLFAFIGMMLWQLFSDALLSPLNSLSSNKEIMTQTYFPREALIFAGLGSVVFNFLIRFLLVTPFLVYYKIPFLVEIHYIILGISALFVLGFSIGLIISPVGLLYTDIQRSLGILLGFAMLLTPVMYPLKKDFVSSKFFIDLNPVSPLLCFTRNSFTSSAPPGTEVYIIILISLLSASIAWIILRVSLPHIISRV
jgi:lipopolysaccharide transport system permease protein